MISESIVNAILKAAKPEAKDNLIKMLLIYINNQYDYYDKKVAHMLEILVDDKAILGVDNIDLQHIIDNPKLIMYDAEKYNIANITVERVDNVDCVAVISYKYLEKLNEDRGDVSYQSTKVNVSFVDYPEIVKK